MIQKSKNTFSAHGSVHDLDFRERLGALRNLPEFFRLIWSCNRLLAVFNILLRVIRASLPLTMLYVGKLIIDEIVFISVTIARYLFNAKIIAKELSKALPDSKIFLGGLGTKGVVDGELQEGVALAKKDTLDTLNTL